MRGPGRRGRIAAPWMVLLVLTGCGADSPVPPPGSGATAPRPVAAEAPVAVRLATALAADADASLEVSGTVRLKRETPLAFNAGGRIATITVREGDAVRRGQVLARLDPTSLAAASSSARAEAERADADYRRLAALFAKGWVTAPRVETARAAALAARARVTQAGFDVGLATIRAPSAGSVLRRPAEPGQMASPGQTVLILGEAASGYVLRLPLADADLERVRLNQPATVTLTGLAGPPLPARVSEIGSRGDDATGTFRVELALPAHPGLRSGLIGTARLRLAGAGTLPAVGAVVVPASAVYAARADEGFVYVYTPATRTVRNRLIQLGPLDDRTITVTAGLKPGEVVVRSGVDRLRDGIRVSVIGT